MKKEPRIIAVEGFDGAGKTTLSKYISDFLGYEYHKSPTGIFAKVRNEFDEQEVSFAERLPFTLAIVLEYHYSCQNVKRKNLFLTGIIILQLHITRVNKKVLLIHY